MVANLLQKCPQEEMKSERKTCAAIYDIIETPGLDPVVPAVLAPCNSHHHAVAAATNPGSPIIFLLIPTAAEGITL